MRGGREFRFSYAVGPAFGAENVLGQAVADIVRGESRALDCSVASTFASPAGAGGLVEWSVVDGLAEVDLPRLGEPAYRVPGV